MASDALVIGGGAWGLNAALALARAGRRVAVLDPGGGAGDPGAASMGLVGALGPHVPAPWTPIKALQFEALLTLPAHAAALAEASGTDPGWRAACRLQPLHDEEARARAELRAAEAGPIWAAAAAALGPAPAPFGWPGGAPRAAVLDAPPDPGWMAPPAHGVWRDDLSALIHPRRYCAALAGACRRAGVVFEPGAALAVDAEGAVLAEGARRAAPLTIAAAGAGSGPLLSPHLPAIRFAAEKGQAALFRLRPPPGAPLIQEGGIWIVPHRDGIAIGSTAEKSWEGPGPDALLDPVLEKAAALCPPLRGREPEERWAGLRPKAGRAPLLGPVPGLGDARGGLWAMTGGAKIGVALAHRMAAALVAALDGAPPPPGLSPAERG